MPTLRDIQNKTIGQVNSLTNALKFSKEDFVVVGDGSVSVSPIDMLANVFKSLKGYDWLVDKVSKFIVYVLPELEWSVKSILLANIQAMMSCSVNPIITKRLIQEGTVFDLNQVDLLNMFRYSPLDSGPSESGFNPRRNYYYFGCTPEDGINYIDDLKDARDFNAVLWYAKNTPNERIVWRRAKDRELPVRITRHGLPGSYSWYKQAKSNGIVTIEFNRNSDSLTTSEGIPMSIQEPMANCLHAWIGCNIPLDLNNQSDIRSDISVKTRNISRYDELCETLEGIKNKMAKEVSRTIEGGITSDEKERLDRLHKSERKTADFMIRKINTAPASGTLDDEIGQYLEADNGGKSRVFTLAGNNGSGTVFFVPNDLLSSTRKKEIHDKKTLEHTITAPTSSEFPSAECNYYYLRTLLEFNTDFVMSMNPLFDEKVVTAQLIDALTGAFSLSADHGSLTLQARFIQAKIRELVERTVGRDSTVVNDCFFSFTNDSYNDMLRQVELARVGLASSDGVPQSIPSAEEVLSDLNSLSPDATKDEVQTAVSASIYKAVSSANPHGPGYLSVDAGFSNPNILSGLLMNLVYVIVSVIVSPKVYILMMMNMKIMETDVSFDLEKFITQFKNMIIELIQSVKNRILDWFIEQLNILMKEVAAQLAATLVAEQYDYYVNLFNRCVKCLRLHMNEYDWAMDDVNYADIAGITEYANEEC